MVKMLTIALILSLATVEGSSHINNNNGNYNQRDLRSNNNVGYYNQGGQNINTVGFNNQRITNVNNGYSQNQGSQLAQNNVGYNQGNRGGSAYGTGSAGTRGRQFSANNYNNRVDSPVGSASFRRNPVGTRNNVYSNVNQGISHGTASTGGGYAGNNVGNVGGYGNNNVGNVGVYSSNNVGTGGGYAGNNVGTVGGYAGNNVGSSRGNVGNNVGTGGGYAGNNVGTVGGYAGNNVGISSRNVGNNVGTGGGYAGNNVGRRERTHGINFGTSVNVNTDYQNNNGSIPSSNDYSGYNVSPFRNTGNVFRNPNSVGRHFGTHQTGMSFNGINSGVHGNGNGGIRYVGNGGISGNVYQGNRRNVNNGIHGNIYRGGNGIYTGVNRGGNSNIHLGTAVGTGGQTSYGTNTGNTGLRGIGGHVNSVGGNGHIGNGYNVNTLAGNGHNVGISGLGNGITNGNNNINRIHGNVGIHSNSGTNAPIGGQSYNSNSGASGLHVSGNVLVNGNRGNTGIVHGNNVNAGLAFGNNVNGGLSNSNNAFARNNNIVNRGSIVVSRRPTFVNTIDFGGQRNTGKRLDQGGQNSLGKRDYSSFGNRNAFDSAAHLGGRALPPGNFRGNVGNSARTDGGVRRGPFNVQDDNSGNRYVTTGNQGPGVDGSSYQNSVVNGNNVAQTYTSTNNNNLVHNANAATGGSGSTASGGNIYVNPRSANAATGGSGSAASGGNVYVNPRSVNPGNVQGNAGTYPDRNTGTLGANGQVNPGHPQGSSRTDIPNTPAAASVAFNTSGAAGGGSDAVNSNCFKDVDISNDFSSSAAGMPRQRIVDELERRPFLRSVMGINGAFIANEFDLLSEPEAPSRFQGSSKTSSLGDDFRFDTSDGFFVDGPDTGTTSGRIRDLRARQLERLQPLLTARSQVCPSNRRPLRSFNMGNQQCFTVNKKNQPTMFATCTRRDCPQCSRGQGVGRCTEVFEKATVFAWCDDNSFSDKIRRMSLLVPKYCSGMSYDC